MKKINKKKMLIIFSVLFTLITLFCFTINKKNHFIYNLVHKQEIFENNELEPDNWEISTVFYDSTVNNGNTPLTEINWDASDGGYGEGETRIIKVQINYKNTNVQRKYNTNGTKTRQNQQK